MRNASVFESKRGDIDKGDFDRENGSDEVEIASIGDL